MLVKPPFRTPANDYGAQIRQSAALEDPPSYQTRSIFNKNAKFDTKDTKNEAELASRGIYDLVAKTRKINGT